MKTCFPFIDLLFWKNGDKKLVPNYEEINAHVEAGCNNCSGALDELKNALIFLMGRTNSDQQSIRNLEAVKERFDNQKELENKWEQIFKEESYLKEFSIDADLLHHYSLILICREVYKYYYKDLKQAGLLIELARQLSEQLPDYQKRSDKRDKLYAQAHIDLAEGNILMALGELNEAVRKYLSAKNTFSELSEPLDIVDTQNNLSIAKKYLKDYSGAIELLEQASVIIEPFEDRFRLANIVHGRGNILRRQKRWQEASNAYQEAFNHYSSIGSELGKAHAILEEGYCGIHLREDDALDKINQALSIYEDCEALIYKARAIAHKGDYYFFNDDSNQASLLYRSSKTLALEHGALVDAALIDLSIARVFQDTNRTNEAVSACKDALTVLEGSDFKEANKAVEQLIVSLRENQETPWEKVSGFLEDFRGNNGLKYEVA